ncbi:MAG: hypothetical protein QOH15_1329 [Gaiellales bacterium]|jgi:hypothetical protein|nr:hypothetical protein [Gaiellales bacterium]
MRATERLLELIIAEAGVVNSKTEAEEESLVTIQQAAIELGRRGDTLVGARDLELIIQALGREQITRGEDEARALNRLAGALGGLGVTSPEVGWGRGLPCVADHRRRRRSPRCLRGRRQRRFG